jgi:arginine-tRNA-protein transferase
MKDADPTFISEQFFDDAVSADRMDDLLAEGWRHFDFSFYRYNYGEFRGEMRLVIPLRIRVPQFLPTKSQRRTLRKNSDLKCEFTEAEITPAAKELFRRHRRRFRENPPDSLYNYLSIFGPSSVPCEVKALNVYDGEKLVAASYFDVGRRSISSVYAIFDPAESKRRLGIFTILKEIEFALETEREFYYLGYCYEGSSFYDYKKQFRGTESFDWDAGWRSFTTMPADDASAAGLGVTDTV